MLVTMSSSVLMTYSTKARFSRNQSEPPSTVMPSGIFLSPRRHMCVSHSKKSRSRPCFLMNLQSAISTTCQTFSLPLDYIATIIITLISDGTGEYLTCSYKRPGLSSHSLLHFNILCAHICVEEGAKKKKKNNLWIIIFCPTIHVYIPAHTIRYACYAVATHRALSLP